MPLRTRLTGTALCLAVIVVLGGAMLLWYAASDDPPGPASTTLLESTMPVYDVQEIHSTYVDASPSTVYEAILAVTPGETALARPFMWLRTLPRRISGRRGLDEDVWHRPVLSVPGTAVLGSDPGREIVVGLIGEFWKLRDAQSVAVVSRQQFMAFDAPGYAVSTLSFHVEPEREGSRVTTITRVRTTDPASHRAFRRYWRAIGTGSALLRRTWLRAVKARAERD